MAYFECVIGSAASGGSGADLIVSCTSNFAGSVITCTNGTDTFTQTCPSTSPYEVTFESIPTGTWTISGVSGGQTFSQSVTITDFTASLNDIPDGATVTPVNDIQIWLHCANIWDKSYTTISQVLSDTSTLLALISSNNAADYMARSTSWASNVCANQTVMGYIGNNDYCANTLLANATWLNAICNSAYFESVLNKKNPTMTSATTPSGQVSASSYQGDTYQPYKAFDSDISNSGWSSQVDGALNQWLTYMFASALKVYKYKIVIYGGGSWNWELQGSNNNSSWTKIKDIVSPAGTNTITGEIINPTSYKYYRLYVKSLVSGNGYYKLIDVRYYGR